MYVSNKAYIIMQTSSISAHRVKIARAGVLVLVKKTKYHNRPLCVPQIVIDLKRQNENDTQIQATHISLAHECKLHFRNPVSI
jgi:hypothetical protein